MDRETLYDVVRLDTARQRDGPAVFCPIACGFLHKREAVRLARRLRQRHRRRFIVLAVHS